MKHCLINKNSETLLIFFAGWACDQYEFEHLKTDFDVLILFDYTDLTINFDFSKYKKFDLIGFSAGVFVSSVVKFDFEISRKIAMNGNPFLFDEQFGLSKEVQTLLYNVTEETADDFAKNYLVKTDEEWKNFHHSKRTIESCRAEFDCLKKIYEEQKQNIKDIFDFAIIGNEDEIFNVSKQKEFYGNKLTVVENARHNLFFRIENYSQIFGFVSYLS